MNKEQHIAAGRPPIVAVVGHIDHGKSTLLDYIRKSNVVAGEAGGITQHLSAYEIGHQTQQGLRSITFLDTPGHEAFRAMRSRGLEVADVAILVVAADDGAKPQTLEALKLIEGVKIPFIVALTKIDKPGANLERAKMSLLEHGVYLEGMGGSVPSIAVSGKTGEGIPELLDLILLAGELEGLTADPKKLGFGIVIESHVDPKRGNTATLIVKDGHIGSGQYVVAGESVAPVRIMENFLGKTIEEALPGSPVQIVGFSSLPAIGSSWRVVESKKEAEEIATAARSPRVIPPTVPTVKKQKEGEKAEENKEEVQTPVLPIIIKTDVSGTGDAVMHELDKLPRSPALEVRVVSRAVGAITEGDVRLASGGQMPGIIIGFNVKVEREARELAERLGVAVSVFEVIYKLTEWLGVQVEERRPRQKVEEKTGSAKLLKIFSTVKGRVILGGRVEEGTLAQGEEVRIMRRDLELGRGEIVSLQSGKVSVKKIESGSEFGAMVKTQVEPASGDKLEAFEIVLK